MTTRTEQLDELLGKARHVGYLERVADELEHRADMAPKGQTRRPRRLAREARKSATHAANNLAGCRARFLKSVESDSAKTVS